MKHSDFMGTMSGVRVFQGGKPLLQLEVNVARNMTSGQISWRPHTTDFPQMVVKSKGNGTPYFREI